MEEGNAWPLPTEITVVVLSYLDINAMCKMDQVSSFFHRFCVLDELWLPLVAESVVKIAKQQYVFLHPSL
jgi:hypothetical protein